MFYPIPPGENSVYSPAYEYMKHKFITQSYYNLYELVVVCDFCLNTLYIPFYSRSMRENLMNSVLEMGHETTIGAILIDNIFPLDSIFIKFYHLGILDIINKYQLKSGLFFTDPVKYGCGFLDETLILRYLIPSFYFSCSMWLLWRQEGFNVCQAFFSFSFNF